MRPVASRFQQFEMTETDIKNAKSVNPYFWVYLQNKIADYAMAVVETEFDPTKTAQDMFAAVLAHEKLKAQVEVLEELMRELSPPTEVEKSDSQPQS